MFVCPVERVHISLRTLISPSKRTWTFTVLKAFFVVYLTMAEVARNPICVKDTVSYETGDWIGVIFRVKPTIMTELCERKLFSRMRTRTRRKCDFATFRFGTLPVCLTTNNSSASFAEHSPHKCETVRFG